MIKNEFILISLIVLFLPSCVPPSMYYWGNYSSTLYSHKKNQTDGSYHDHKNSLSEIIDKSTELGTKVPPGVYAELGYIYYQEGDSSEGKKYFELEVVLYPESAYFINKMIARINEAE